MKKSDIVRFHEKIEKHVSKLEKENHKLKSQIAIHEERDEILTELAISCGAAPYGGGAAGKNAIKCLAAEIKRLKTELAYYTSNEPTEAELELQHEEDTKQAEIDKKAKTVTFLDTLFFELNNWSDDSQTAPDIELAIKSVVFPLVFANLDDDNNILDAVPTNALDVLHEGRELIRDFRSTNDFFITQNWDKHAPIFQTWARERMLPALYGRTNPNWSDTATYTAEQMNAWQTRPADQTRNFPRIADAIQLLEGPAFENLSDFLSKASETRIQTQTAA